MGFSLPLVDEDKALPHYCLFSEMVVCMINENERLNILKDIYLTHFLVLTFFPRFLLVAFWQSFYVCVRSPLCGKEPPSHGHVAILLHEDVSTTHPCYMLSTKAHHLGAGLKGLACTHMKRKA